MRRGGTESQDIIGRLGSAPAQAPGAARGLLAEVEGAVDRLEALHGAGSILVLLLGAGS